MYNPSSGFLVSRFTTGCPTQRSYLIFTEQRWLCENACEIQDTLLTATTQCSLKKEAQMLQMGENKDWDTDDDAGVGETYRVP